MRSDPAATLFFYVCLFLSNNVVVYISLLATYDDILQVYYIFIFITVYFVYALCFDDTGGDFSDHNFI